MYRNDMFLMRDGARTSPHSLIHFEKELSLKHNYKGEHRATIYTPIIAACDRCRCIWLHEVSYGC